MWDTLLGHEAHGPNDCPWKNGSDVTTVRPWCIWPGDERRIWQP